MIQHGSIPCNCTFSIAIFSFSSLFRYDYVRSGRFHANITIFLCYVISNKGRMTLISARISVKRLSTYITSLHVNRTDETEISATIGEKLLGILNSNITEVDI